MSSLSLSSKGLILIDAGWFVILNLMEKLIPNFKEAKTKFDHLEQFKVRSNELIREIDGLIDVNRSPNQAIELQREVDLLEKLIDHDF